MLLRLWETLLCIDDTASLCACLCVCVFERVYTCLSDYKAPGSPAWRIRQLGVRGQEVSADG